MKTLVKDPSAVKDYGFDWTLWMSSGDTISTSTFSGGLLGVTSSSISSYNTTCFVTCGTAGTFHKVTNRIITSQGRTEERSFDMQIINL
jgi:hypothetical protein